MIPLGYCTIPEALELIEFKASEGSPFEWLDAALADAGGLFGSIGLMTLHS